jgi:transmembrane sensor
MKMNKELIQRFFKNQCTAEEAEYVTEHLRDHPYLLDEHLPQLEWDELTKLFSFPEDKKQQILGRIRNQLQLNHSGPESRYWWLAAAASVFLLITLGIVLHKKPQQRLHQQDLVYNLVKINYGKDDIPLKIEDGSFILLKAGSELHYPEHFKGKERTFFLKGEARFKVFKDRSRPFNVHAGGTITTALGTEFTISAHPKDSHTKIILHEGRIVVKPEHPEQYAHSKDVYLVAGEQLSVNKNTYLTALSRTKVKVLSPVRLAGSTEITAAAITFQNQSLKNIYRSLDKEFSVRIHYKDAEIADRYFTGSFKRDSLTLDKIIQETALLNQLNIEKRDSTSYYLSIRQHKDK